MRGAALVRDLVGANARLRELLYAAKQAGDDSKKDALSYIVVVSLHDSSKMEDSGEASRAAVAYERELFAAGVLLVGTETHSHYIHGRLYAYIERAAGVVLLFADDDKAASCEVRKYAKDARKWLLEWDPSRSHATEVASEIRNKLRSGAELAAEIRKTA